MHGSSDLDTPGTAARRDRAGGRAVSLPVTLALLALLAVFAAGVTDAAARAAAPGEAAAAESGRLYTAEQLAAMPPPGPNPYLAFLPAGATPDWGYWRAWARWQALEKRRRSAVGPLPEVIETEPAGTAGVNDLPFFAQALAGVGTRPGDSSAVRVAGALLAAPATLPPAVEPDGSIALATLLALAPGEAVAVAGAIGDGAHGSGGSGSGDFDFYRLSGTAGALLAIAVNTPEPLADLDPIVGLYDAAGTLVDVNDNAPGSGLLTTLDSFLVVTLPAAGDYYVAVGGRAPPGTGPDVEDMLPADPFDPASGPGAGSEGVYEVAVGLDPPDPADVDLYALDLRAGDVVGAALFGAGRRVFLLDPDGEPRVSALGRDLSAIYPEVSPLPGGGEAAIAYVADRAGRWTVGVAAAERFDRGAYGLEVRVERPPLDRSPTPARQVLYIDFDGATLDAAEVGGPAGEVTLSPLAAFLDGWNLGPADEAALAAAVTAVAVESLSADLRQRGGNGDFAESGRFGDFDLDVRTSLDAPDPYGEPGVSRVIVGGRRDELGLETIGIAASVDVGDFDVEETAVVLLDLLSGPADDPNSLRSLERAPGVALFDLVAVALGNLVAHEAGHLLANFHTARDLGRPTVMDRGGRLEVLAGLGNDGVFGTADDVDVDFGPDAYSPAEAFTGTENTLEAISFGLPAGGPRPELTLAPAALGFGALEPGASADATLAVGNAGSLPLSVGGSELTGPDADRFAVVAGAPPFVLAAGASRQLTVRFTPGGNGARRAAVELASDDPAAAAAEVPLTGQGGVPVMAVEPPAIDFGDLVYDGEPGISAAAAVTVRNPGAGELVVAPWGLAGPDAGRFAVGQRPPLVVPAGGEAELTAIFRPGGAVGSMQALLALAGNDPAAPRADVALAGRALGPDIDVDPGSPYFFGSIRPGSERRRTFTVANLGQRPLTVTAAAIGGDGAAAFAILSGGPPFTLGAGEERGLELVFRPPAVELYEALLTLASDDPDEDPFELALAGAGVVPELTVTPPTHDFGSLEPGGEAARFFRVENTGGFRLTVGASELTGPAAAVFAIDRGGAPFSLAPGGVRLVRVVFRPETGGFAVALLRLTSDDPERPLVELGLVGNDPGQGPPGAPAEIPTLGPVAALLLALLLAAAALGHLRR